MMGEGQYAVGMEPCSNGFGRDAVRAAGELIVLQLGKRRGYRTDISIIDAGGAAALRQRNQKLVDSNEAASRSG